MHENSRLLFEKYAKPYFASNVRVLEIGPDQFPSTFQVITKHSIDKWDYLDIRDRRHGNILSADGYHFPVEVGAYDVVFSASVVEHVKAIWDWMPELARVCRRGGLVVTICPTSWPYHEAPVDCWRIYPEGMAALYRHAGLTVEVNVNASLEDAGMALRIPGRSLSHVKDGLKLNYMAAMKSGGPCECAYDTICIGRKL